MAVSMADITKLRKMTGAGMMDCKNALTEAEGDFDKAMEIIRKKGQAVAAKRSEREASEGCVLAKTTGDRAVIVALKCETDFVAQNADFVKLTQDILDLASFLTCSQCDEKKDTILFIDPGFPVQKQQLVVMGQKFETFDVYDYRGDKLKEKLESYLKKGNISAIIYSNPNNPSWICLKEEELRIIGELATQYDVIVLEDLAYFAMDFRQDLSKPYQPPFQPSVAHYTDNYVLLISGSKAFSYAGQRIGVSCISDKLYHRSYPGLTKRYGGGTFGTVFIHRVLYALSSGTSHSAQFAMAAMLKAANEGQYNFLNEVKIYGERAQKLKEIFLRHGFHLVYDNDLGDPIADGFYFTIGYPGMTSGELAKELMYYGVSAISLVTTGSHQEGLRACTSFIKDHQYAQLDERMKLFAENHPIA